MCGVETRPVKLIREVWNSYPPNSRILHTSHSQGGIHTKNASCGCDPSLLQRISAIGIAPAARPKKKMFGSCVNVASVRDIVPYLEHIAPTRPLTVLTSMVLDEPLQLLTPHSDASWFDHSFDSPTFSRFLDKNITAGAWRSWRSRSSRMPAFPRTAARTAWRRPLQARRSTNSPGRQGRPHPP